MKTVKLSSKGQITLPAEALRAVKARKGTEFLVIQKGHRIVLLRAQDAAEQLVDDLGGWEHLAAPAFEQLWGTEADEVWDEA